jgi:endogenous inhibitor of DNA gyrase (YacG/DUF329 family)
VEKVQNNEVLHGDTQVLKLDNLRSICGICHKDFRDLFHHVKTVHERMGRKEKIPCPECKKDISYHNFSRHIRESHEKIKTPCPVCGKYFAESNLSAHIRSVHEKIKVECDICGKKFDRDHLKRHKRMVHKKIRIECDICGKKFDCDHLKRHKRRVKRRLKLNVIFVGRSLIVNISRHIRRLFTKLLHGDIGLVLRRWNCFHFQRIRLNRTCFLNNVTIVMFQMTVTDCERTTVAMARPDRLQFKKSLACGSASPGPRVHVVRQPLGPGSRPGRGFGRRKAGEIDLNKEKEEKNSIVAEDKSVTEKIELCEQFQRVKEFLTGRKHGLYMTQVERKYNKKWGEVFNSEWWEEMKKLRVVDIEVLDSGHMVKWVD